MQARDGFPQAETSKYQTFSYWIIHKRFLLQVGVIGVAKNKIYLSYKRVGAIILILKLRSLIQIYSANKSINMFRYNCKLISDRYIFV